MQSTGSLLYLPFYPGPALTPAGGEAPVAARRRDVAGFGSRYLVPGCPDAGWRTGIVIIAPRHKRGHLQPSREVHNVKVLQCLDGLAGRNLHFAVLIES